MADDDKEYWWSVHLLASLLDTTILLTHLVGIQLEVVTPVFPQTES